MNARTVAVGADRAGRPIRIRTWDGLHRYDVFVGGWRVALLQTARGAVRRARREATL